MALARRSAGILKGVEVVFIVFLCQKAALISSGVKSLPIIDSATTRAVQLCRAIISIFPFSSGVVGLPISLETWVFHSAAFKSGISPIPVKRVGMCRILFFSCPVGCLWSVKIKVDSSIFPRCCIVRSVRGPVLLSFRNRRGSGRMQHK